jgi:hypothetical protein
VDLKIRIDPDIADRALIVELDSEAFFRSSLITLVGEDSPSTYWLRFDSLPAGDYLVRVSVERSGGESISTAGTFLVSGALESGS